MENIVTLVVITIAVIGFGVAALLPILFPGKDDEDDA